MVSGEEGLQGVPCLSQSFIKSENFHVVGALNGYNYGAIVDQKFDSKIILNGKVIDGTSISTAGSDQISIALTPKTKPTAQILFENFGNFKVFGGGIRFSDIQVFDKSEISYQKFAALLRYFLPCALLGS